MNADVQLLLEIAMRNKALRVRNFADLARAIDESEQTLVNWKRRGIPRAKLLPLARKVGCDPQWLEEGKIPATSTQNAAFIETVVEEMRSRHIHEHAQQAIMHILYGCPPLSNDNTTPEPQ